MNTPLISGYQEKLPNNKLLDGEKMKLLPVIIVCVLSTMSSYSMQIIIEQKNNTLVFDIAGDKIDDFEVFLKALDSKVPLYKKALSDDFHVRCIVQCHIDLDMVNEISKILKPHGLDHQTILALKSPYLPSSQIIFTTGTPTEFELRARIPIEFNEKKSNQPTVKTPVESGKAQGAATEL